MENGGTGVIPEGALEKFGLSSRFGTGFSDQITTVIGDMQVPQGQCGDC